MTNTLMAQRHDRLFELIRQGRYAAVISAQVETKPPVPMGAARLFARAAAASI